MKTSFNKPVARLYKTAILICTGEYVAITAFIPACPEFGHGDFFWVKTIPGVEFSVTPAELSNFCL